ncbi:hypothetical protein [Acidipila rosea]|uniref:hypothetical protein n=1 Tax=Acidipila rosea TaxID=768535 RepID=UPI0010452620|nr:hypothetical protein [Acidipila rosea]
MMNPETYIQEAERLEREKFGACFAKLPHQKATSSRLLGRVTSYSQKVLPSGCIFYRMSSKNDKPGCRPPERSEYAGRRTRGGEA